MLSAQFYTTGDSPSRIKWNYIKGNNYKVIYPQEIDSLAQRYLWLLESERERIMAGLEISPKQIPVILHPYTTISNGLVVWAPKRMELYTIPPANRGYAQNWERQLVLHESRHVGQMSHFTQGVYKPLNYIFGQQITGLGVGIYASKWLLEGDAVIAETELSNSGRGRNASFLEYYRAAFLSGDYRNWYKWRYGSYKYYYPDIYAFGYLINSTIRKKSNNYLAAGELFNYYVKDFYKLNVQRTSLKKVAGAWQKPLLKDGIEMYTKLWSEDFAKRGRFTEPESIRHKERNYYYEYKSPVTVGKDSIYCIRYSYDNPTALVLLSSNEKFLKEHKNGEAVIRAFGSSASNLKSYERKIYWTESVISPRWGKESHNILFSYNADTKKITRLSNKSSYNNPALSSSGDSLSVTEYPIYGGSNLVILNSETGEKLHTVSAPDNGQITESAWIGNTIYALVITEKGLGLFTLKPTEGNTWERIVKEQSKSINCLNSHNGLLYFESDIDGVNNIWSLNPNTEELIRYTNAKFAAHDPHISNGKIYYTDLQLGGKMPVYTYIGDTVKQNDTTQQIYIENGTIKNSHVFEVAEMLSDQANRFFAANNISQDTTIQAPSLKYKPARYRKGAHLFRFHSWAPLYYNIDKIKSMSFDHFYEVVSLGATAYSQNSLGTAVTMLGYSFREGHHAAHASFEYSGFYPVFKITADYNTSDRRKYRIEQNGNSAQVYATSNGVPLFNLSALAYIPINLSSRGWQRGLLPQIMWEYENNAFYSNKNNSYVNKQQIIYALQYYQMRPVANSAIFPKWGFSAKIMSSFSPNGHENFGKALAGYTYFYTPGIMPRQGLKLSAAYQKQFTDNKWMYLDNLISMPRGYNDYYGNEYYKLSADYAIPINLRGFSLGWLAYFKRLQVIPFADFACIKGNHGTQNLNSYGCDLLLDAVICHIGIPVSLGVRCSKINDAGTKGYIGLLSSISLF